MSYHNGYLGLMYIVLHILHFANKYLLICVCIIIFSAYLSMSKELCFYRLHTQTKVHNNVFLKQNCRLVVSYLFMKYSILCGNVGKNEIGFLCL